MKKKNLRLVIPLIILLSFSLACQDPIQFFFNIKDIAFPPTSTNDPQMATPTAKPKKNSGSNSQSLRFTESDCNVSGVVFQNKNVGYTVTDVFDGNSLTCHTSSTGAHGLSEMVNFSIYTLKPSSLDALYEEKKSVDSGFVEQANEWNALPDLPADIRDEITFIRDDGDGYIFLITSWANVQNCVNGDGYGVEKVNGKYLVVLSFTSCEGDAGSYLATMQNMRQASLAAIQRIEGGN
ncbi:MAG: hypothetical protein AB9897_09700 [Anaerolineaceae bacterium]